MRLARIFVLSAAVTGATGPAPLLAAPPPDGGTALTIYSGEGLGAYPDPGSARGYAMVRQERDIDLARGRNEIRFSDVAALIDPTTVSFESLTDPKGTSVQEQNFQFDLVSTEKLLSRFLDREVTVDQIRGQATQSFTGTLLSTQGGIVLKRDDGTVQIVPDNAGVKLPALPGGLLARPTLVWNVDARTAGRHRTRVSYQTKGIGWWTDYNAILSEASGQGACKLDLGAWVSIVNTSGSAYADARLKLVAGNINRARMLGDRIMASSLQAQQAKVAVSEGFAEKAFFEYHLYTLGRLTNLPNNSTKQIELFPVARSVPCERTLVYYGRSDVDYSVIPNPITDRDYGVQSNSQVDIYLQFRNAEASNLGIPLPGGRIRVSKLDPADKTLEFVGENWIDHTPRNEKVLLKLGSAFDVIGERRQTNFKVDTSRKTLTEDIEIRLRSAKKEPVTVQVKETLYRWVNWEITQPTHEFRKDDARNVYFPVTVPAEGETVVRYSVRYWW